MLVFPRVDAIRVNRPHPPQVIRTRAQTAPDGFDSRRHVAGSWPVSRPDRWRRTASATARIAFGCRSMPTTCSRSRRAISAGISRSRCKLRSGRARKLPAYIQAFLDLPYHPLTASFQLDKAEVTASSPVSPTPVAAGIRLPGAAGACLRGILRGAREGTRPPGAAGGR